MTTLQNITEKLVNDTCLEIVSRSRGKYSKQHLCMEQVMHSEPVGVNDA
jgi:hypothetical protein